MLLLLLLLRVELLISVLLTALDDKLFSITDISFFNLSILESLFFCLELRILLEYSFIEVLSLSLINFSPAAKLILMLFTRLLLSFSISDISSFSTSKNRKIISLNMYFCSKLSLMVKKPIIISQFSEILSI